MRSVTYVFHGITNNNAVIQKPIELCEAWSQKGLSCQRTPLAFLCMIVNQRKYLENQRGKVTTDQLAEFYSKITWSTGSEKMSKNLLENASAISNKWQTCKEVDCMAIVARSEEFYGMQGPFVSVLSIYLMCKTAGKCTQLLAWVFEMVFDSFRAQTITRESLGPSSLQKQGRVNDIDIIIAKRELHVKLLGDILSSFGFPSALKTQMRDFYKSAKSFRAKAGFPDNEFAKHTQKVDLGFKQPWSRAEVFFDHLVTGLIFGKAYDSTVRQCLKLNKSVEDTLDYGAIGQAIQQVHDALEEAKNEEKKAKSVGNDTAEAAGDSHDQQGDQEDVESQGFQEDEVLEARERWMQFAKSQVKTYLETLVYTTNESSMVDKIKKLQL